MGGEPGKKAAQIQNGEIEMTDLEKSQTERTLAELRAARRGAVYRLETLADFYRDACRREAALIADPAAQRQLANVRDEMAKICKLTIKTERKIATIDELSLRLAAKLDRATRMPHVFRNIRELWILEPMPRPSFATFAAGLVAGLPVDGIEAFPNGAADADRALQRAKKNHRIF
jgi:hypothetical protein